MHSGMPLCRNHFRRSRDAPTGGCYGQPHSTTAGGEVQIVAYVDVAVTARDSPGTNPASPAKSNHPKVLCACYSRSVQAGPVGSGFDRLIRSRDVSATTHDRLLLPGSRFGVPRVIPECIPFTAIPHTTRIFSDFLAYAPEVRPFYPHSPDAAQVTAFSKVVPHGTEIHARVADALERQNRAWGGIGCRLAQHPAPARWRTRRRYRAASWLVWRSAAFVPESGIGAGAGPAGGALRRALRARLLDGHRGPRSRRDQPVAAADPRLQPGSLHGQYRGHRRRACRQHPFRRGQ